MIRNWKNLSRQYELSLCINHVAEAAGAAPVVSADDLERVRALWSRLREAFESGYWTQYGEVMEELDRAITE